MKEMNGYTAKQQGECMLNANELYQNVNEFILQEIMKELSTIAYNRYPDERSIELIEAYARVYQLPTEQILAGNGSDEMLGLLIGCFLGKGKTLYTLLPDFSMYNYYAGMYDSHLYAYPCERSGTFDIEAFIEKGREQNVDMVLFSNPNNPTGHFLTNHEIIEIVEAFPTIPVIIDEAYGEFASESMMTCLNEYDNLYVTRTLSKAYGLAGARLGFLMSNEHNIMRLSKYMVPYNISSITQKIGTVVLRHADTYLPLIHEIKTARDSLYKLVSCMERITFYPSQANYLFGRCEGKQELLDQFCEEGIVIRNYKDDSFRITIGSKEENKRVYAVLQKFERARKEATL